MEYHSALKSIPPTDYEPVKRFEDGDSIAFVFDINGAVKLPDPYNAADIFYAELPYKLGYETFMKRAGKNAYPDYKAFINTINRLTAWMGKPVAIIGPSVAQSVFGTFERIPIGLNGAKVWLYVKNLPIESFDGETNKDLLHWLSKRYDCIGDFACGYGLSARIFKERGKNYVCSDVNPKAIGGLKALING